ncbi:GMC family oxidoreductase [Gammaproteobacteria bacterium]|nr:GMC family oxidoreductase [Gammaproteobacteria bacterium]
MPDTNNISRRRFMQNATKVGLSLMAAGCSSTHLPESEQDKAQHKPRVSAFNEPDRYQYIVVGAGAGGGPLAVRLAKRGYDVLLLDAGGDVLPESAKIPAFHASSTEDPAIAWDYTVHHRDEIPARDITAVEPVKDQLNIWYPRASGIGGCTTHNAMIAMYPHPQDWQKIYAGAKDAQVPNFASWHPHKMRQLYEERVEKKDYQSGDNTGWHHLEMNSIWPGITDPNLRATLIKAARSGIGGSIFDTLRDVNRLQNLDKEGFFMIPKSTHNGSRYGVYEYVMENLGRSARGGYLSVLPHTLVKRVLFKTGKDNSLRATGVEVAIGKNLYRAHRKSGHDDFSTRVFKADNEVILSAGAFNTPQLLLLSGIGPASHFASAAWRQIRGGKKWKVLEGVGKNLQDRYEVSVVSAYKRDFNFIADCEFKTEARLDPCYRQWQDSAERDSSIYASNGIAGGLKLRSQNQARSGGPQDLILFGLPGDFRGYYPGYSNAIFGPDGQNRNYFSWAILKGYTNNRSGQVKLKTADFRDTPYIHFNYFGEGKELDLNAIHEAIQLIRNTNAQLGDKIEKELFPGRQVSSEAQIKRWIEREAWGHHASCSAKMGHKSDKAAVVDFNFKVHGTQNLRIVDASVFPDIPGLFISVPIYTIAERAADVIDLDHALTKESRSI